MAQVADVEVSNDGAVRVSAASSAVSIAAPLSIPTPSMRDPERYYLRITSAL